MATPLRADAEDPPASGDVEEVMVTAQRRLQSLQDVPISVTAYSGEDLDRIGAPDLTSIGQSTPNVTLEVSRGTNTTLTAFIRGVGQQDPVAGFESGVGLYIDDVYLNRPQATVLDIYDVQRIEVLRGPQGTLYGRNTIGGAIKYVTKPLADEPEATLRFSVGSYNQFDAVVTGSAPVADSLRIGGALARLTRNGFGDNLTYGGLENYEKDILAGRFSMEWQPSDAFTLKLATDKIVDDSDPRQGHRLTAANVSGQPILSNVFDTMAGLNNPIQKVRARGVAVTAEWALNDRITMKNIYAYRDDDSYSPIDFDSLEQVDLDVPVVYTNDQRSEELQFLYSSARLNGVVGVYWLNANAFDAFDVILGETGDLLGLPGLNSFTLGNVDTSTWSVFADFTYDFSDAWSLALGGRYTSDKRSSRVLRQTMIGGTSSYFGGTATPIATTSDFDGSKTFEQFTPRLSLSWQPAANHNLYFTYSEGFKGGSFDPRGQTSAAPDLNGDGTVGADDIFQFMLFDPETVDSYEVGVKSTWLDRRINTSFALFHANYKDVQIPGSVGFDSDNDGVVDSFIGITSNAGKADMDGLEAEGSARAGEHVSFGWTLGYIDAKYKEFIDAFGNDVADERVFQNTPKWTSSLSFTYEHPMQLFAQPGSFSVINSLAYRSKASQFETPNEFLDQSAYTLWDLSLVWEDDGGRWRAGVHGRNLTDEEYKVAGYYFPTLGLEGTVTAFYGNPRTITGTVEYHF